MKQETSTVLFIAAMATHRAFEGEVRMVSLLGRNEVPFHYFTCSYRMSIYIYMHMLSSICSYKWHFVNKPIRMQISLSALLVSHLRASLRRTQLVRKSRPPSAPIKRWRLHLDFLQRQVYLRSVWHGSPEQCALSVI